MTARMANNINGIFIDGVSINAYIYAILAFILLALIIYKSVSKNTLGIKNIGRMILIAIFCFWIALELLFTVNYINFSASDFSMLFRKPLEIKWALTSPPGLFEFTQLVDKNIHNASKLALVTPGEYFTIKTKYFLAPRNLVDTLEAEYIAGYGIQPGRYKIFASTPYGWVAKK